MKKLLLLTITMLIGFANEALANQPTKGFWLTNIASRAMYSKDGLQKVVDDCVKYGFNTIYTVTWNRGCTLYPSKVMKSTFGVEIMPGFEGRDPLKELIELAKPKGIKVIAWFEFGFSYAYKNEGGAFIAEKKPHWVALGSDGKVVQKNGFYWMNAFDEEVQDFILSLVKEVVTSYDIDGIQGDDRLPAVPSEAGYDAQTVQRYMKEHDGVAPPKDCKQDEWVQWRADILNSFMGKLYHEVKALKKSCVVSMSPSIYPWSKYEYLQDWPSWVKNGYVDNLCPQVYRYDVKAYEKALKENVLEYLPKGYLKKLSPGILLKVDDYVAADDYLRSAVQINRKNGVKGEVFFFYEGISLRSDFFKSYKKLK
jgi:uncharacterized lipoprotein YddW (UPF0748 family)